MVTDSRDWRIASSGALEWASAESPAFSTLLTPLGLRGPRPNSPPQASTLAPFTNRHLPPPSVHWSK